MVEGIGRWRRGNHSIYVHFASDLKLVQVRRGADALLGARDQAVVCKSQNCECTPRLVTEMLSSLRKIGIGKSDQEFITSCAERALGNRLCMSLST